MQYELARTFNPKLVDLIVNHPSVRGTIEQGCEAISSRSVVLDRQNIILASPIGVAIFIPEAERIYGGHIAVLAGHRGRAALTLATEALKQVFCVYKAEEVRASVPLVLPAARYLCRAVGFTPLGVCSAAGVEHFKMEAGRWADL
jgi:hypothetical protein